MNESLIKDYEGGKVIVGSIPPLLKRGQVQQVKRHIKRQIKNNLIMTDYSSVPVEKLLKTGFQVLYDEKDPKKALEIYDTVLSKYPNNTKALVYRAASLEKLYFGEKESHLDSVIEDAHETLSKALVVAQGRGDRERIAFIYFRIFIHYFNRKMYPQAENFFKLAKEHGYNDATFSMWEQRLQSKLAKLTSNNSQSVNVAKLEVPESISSLPVQEEKVTFRSDWYQTPNYVTISLFTDNLPSSTDDVKIEIPDGQNLCVSFKIASKGSEFQYETKLSHKIESGNIQCKVFTKKIEIVFEKVQKRVTWHTLSVEEKTSAIQKTPKDKKDWSNIDIDEEDEDGNEENGSADAFFQKIYADADPDTRRAMMKSFVESNGTTLNTSWGDVKDATVETVPPEGSELKHF
ncbi:similar to Saccharomyces cerevisiae YOR057W SGT1 Cochaperone protein [Maudiozyma barnettii]|uniref:Similar to Saccharomyces cerevisiae YOR057W SGT1 Cochaperone protein n=1 Tax=Maudiozyma barnettii TaxID=61262 RepID=A0A8H2ZHQ6_9SACH|nr:co-chaperone SGT1 [Kazachstania barnettii]CAB4256029.1 similar to Saccharomyces cerevisiae YOR057W SGT1 Cochaperone protein [Kazachstania barnettii]CAD1784637.1 similar to Saccharomyces cerevisiae YOR057W SGT1 Cochaperone protein [Kazachstania barnettii]